MFKHNISEKCELCGRVVGKTANAKRKIPIMLCSKCLRSPPPEEYRCCAEVGNGTKMSPKRQCKRWAIWDKGLCGTHNKIKKGNQ